jgi:large subunit ribosomal protein L15
MPLHRRLPKRGFTNIYRKEYAIVNVAALEALEGNSFDPGTLLEAGVIHKLKHGLKILGSGDLKRKITVKAHVFSKSALDKIQAAGGTAEVIA